MTITDIAKLAHEANRVYCQIIGDDSQVPWDEAPEWQKESALDGVRRVIENANYRPQESHENWCQHKYNDGWKYGPVKDPEAKTHPCLVPYRDLPAEQQKKDALFLSIVRAVCPPGEVVFSS